MTRTADAHIGDIWRWYEGDSSAVVLVIQDINEKYEFEGLTLYATGWLANRVNLVHTWYPAGSRSRPEYGWEQLA
jgi:hypothetical protein